MQTIIIKADHMEVELEHGHQNKVQFLKKREELFKSIDDLKKNIQMKIMFQDQHIGQDGI